MGNINTELRIIQVHEPLKIGNNIKSLRKKQGLKQNVFLARLQVLGIDISIYSLSRIESGVQNPTVSFLLATCRVLDCDMNTLFGLDILE